MSSKGFEYQDYYTGKPAPRLLKKSKEDPDQPEQRRPWHQQQSETGSAYSAFLLYLDMGRDRSHEGLADVLYGNPESTAQIEKWSKKYEWLVRSDAWDRYVSDTRVQAMEEALIEAERVALRYLPDITLALCKAATGDDTIKREQMQAIRDYMDRFGAAKQQRQAPTTINNFTVKYPELPKQVKDRMEVENAEFEVLPDHARNLIPEELRNRTE